MQKNYRLVILDFYFALLDYFISIAFFKSDFCNVLVRVSRIFQTKISTQKMASFLRSIGLIKAFFSKH